MLKRFALKWVILTLCLGAIIGSALGQLVGLILPDGVVHDFFTRSASAGITPTTIDLAMFSVTVGFMIRVNVIGIIGIAMAAYFLRWYK